MRATEPQIAWAGHRLVGQRRRGVCFFLFLGINQQRINLAGIETGQLCVDEVGYLSFDDKSADLLYEVINRRYERKSVILRTN